MDSWEKLDENTLPPKEAFYSNFNLGNVSDEDYKYAQKVWDVFKITNLGEYHNIYVQGDKFVNLYLSLRLIHDMILPFSNNCDKKLIPLLKNFGKCIIAPSILTYLLNQKNWDGLEEGSCDLERLWPLLFNICL